MTDPQDRLKDALADRYAIEREIGRGGMATVYLARDLKHQRPVAVKVLGAELASVLGPERFLREIEVAAGLSHPHILPVHDSGEADGLLYYVMPYVEGESLRARLDREKQLSVDDALRISRERVERQREAAETALRLAPELPQAHAAKGLFLYFSRRDWQGALDAYAVALEGLPNDAGMWARIGFVHRRMGNWEQAIAAMEKAAVLDPRYAEIPLNLANTYRVLHRYPEAVRSFDRAWALAPDLPEALVGRGWVYAAWTGQLDSVQASLQILSAQPRIDSRSGEAHTLEAELALWKREVLPARNARPRLYQGQRGYLPAALYDGWTMEILGDSAAARIAFEAALQVLDSALAELPDDWRVHAAIGYAEAGLGRREEARRQCAWLRGSRCTLRMRSIGPTSPRRVPRSSLGWATSTRPWTRSTGCWLSRPASASTFFASIPGSIPSATTPASRPSW